MFSSQFLPSKPVEAKEIKKSEISQDICNNINYFYIKTKFA